MKIAGIYFEQSKFSLNVTLDKSFHFVFALMAKVKCVETLGSIYCGAC